MLKVDITKYKVIKTKSFSKILKLFLLNYKYDHKNTSLEIWHYIKGLKCIYMETTFNKLGSTADVTVQTYYILVVDAMLLTNKCDVRKEYILHKVVI